MVTIFTTMVTAFTIMVTVFTTMVTIFTTMVTAFTITVTVFTTMVTIFTTMVTVFTIMVTVFTIMVTVNHVCIFHTGNFYSLRSQHAKAVLYFQRALRLNPNYLSAWTLMGHEYMELKNTPAAIEAYRQAIGTKTRNYLKELVVDKDM